MIKERFVCYRSNYRLTGKVERPLGENLPIAILSHGFLANSNMMTRYRHAFARIGYAAFSFDFAGGSIIGKSSGKLTDMSLLTEVADLEAVIAFAEKQPYVRSDKITLMGCSQGGVVSALCAAAQPNKIHSLVLFYPALCIPDDARKGKMMMFSFDPGHIPPIMKSKIPFLKLSHIYPEAVIQMDIWREIRGYTGNILIVHGTKDKIVNSAYIERAEKEYKASGAKCRVVFIEGGAHMFSRKHDKAAIKVLQDFCLTT